MVIRLGGRERPDEVSAERTRSLLSPTALSGSPYNIKSRHAVGDLHLHVYLGGLEFLERQRFERG